MSLDLTSGKTSFRDDPQARKPACCRYRRLPLRATRTWPYHSDTHAHTGFQRSGIVLVSSFCCVFFPVPSWFFQKMNTESANRHPWSSSSFVQPESGFSCTEPDMLHYISDSCKSLRFAQSFAGASCVGQVIAKVCASWELYEHSNGFRAKNF